MRKQVCDSNESHKQGGKNNKNPSDISIPREKFKTVF